MKLPEGYRGAVAATVERLEDHVIDIEVDMPEGSLQVQAEFDEMIVWGQEAPVDASDPYLRGAEEWLALAEKVGYQIASSCGPLVADVYPYIDPRVPCAGGRGEMREYGCDARCVESIPLALRDGMPSQRFISYHLVHTPGVKHTITPPSTAPGWFGRQAPHRARSREQQTASEAAAPTAYG